ncbi:MAG TPA: phosphoenolpyruvate carboxykinase (GTP) [Candidatus Krumholzibacteria bacterium]|nr:phosphoenolpyruvate carboxykinase (GTP) [Candidatus Krumholzibacteria bacterium]HPD70168.1 phosphoenolpyruvate carboxykinase (GTP) [Candidatus Krumholzibacteria bacterium]HRY40132.1 phosphoenolpyruvate carboxykinase (GTP) [Candidatus Krumholzibacteria bacterium]
MLELKKGVDILGAVGGVTTIAAARTVIATHLDGANQKKLAPIRNEEALLKIANAIVMCEPDGVFVNSGSPEDVQWVRDHALAKGEETPLAKKGHTLHFDLPQDQARLVNQTFYIINPGETVSSLAKYVLREEALAYVEKHVKGIMKGMTMMIGFYSRGPVGAEASIPAIEITSSAYVVHSAELLYRNCYDAFDQEAKRRGIFFTNVHSEGPNRPEDVPNARIFMDRSWLTTYATFCTYAGNTLLMKKGNHRSAVDYATYYRRGEELSEHMFITGLTGPRGRRTFFAGAAPSGCGKTTTAMVGTNFVGDDLAQMWIARDGTLRAVNPEKGIFGIVEDVNREGDPHLMAALRDNDTEVIWSNVLVDDEGVPYWTGCGETMPPKGRNFQGEWFSGKTDASGNPVPPSHKNSRCTLDCREIANHDAAANADPAGVPIKVITYSGRDSDTMPPVWVARTADAGVAIGASIVSKATATEVGASGVNRQPWANAPFIPGPLADYMEAQFQFFNSPKFSHEGRPVLAGLNYFLTHANRGSRGSGLLGEKKDVRVWLGWLERYVHGEARGIETPIGMIPRYAELKVLFAEIGKPYPRSLYDLQFALYVDNIVARIDLQTAAYAKEANLPPQLFREYETMKAGLLALRAKFGPIVQVAQLAPGD